MDGDDRKSLKQPFFTDGWKVIWISLAVCVIVVGLSYYLLDWLQTSSTSVETRVGDTIQTVTTEVTESGSTTLRTIGFVIAGLVAAIIAAWRSNVASRQAKAAQDQVAAANKQVANAQATLKNQQRTLLADQFQRATETLSSPVLAIRLGGIYRLDRIAEGNQEEYHLQVMHQICAFVRFPTYDPSFDDNEFVGLFWTLRDDVQFALLVIGRRGKSQMDLAGNQAFHLDLNGADLKGADLKGLNLSSPDVESIGSMPIYQAYTDAELRTDLTGAKLDDADFTGTNICGVDFSRYGKNPATGLTLNQLAAATASRHKPPMLDGVRDRETRIDLGTLIWEWS